MTETDPTVENEEPEVEETEGTAPPPVEVTDPNVGISSDLAQFNESIGYPLEGQLQQPAEGLDAESEVESTDDDDEAEVPEAAPAAYTTGSKSVSAVQADVEAGTVSAADALAAEQSLSSPRPTLVNWLSNYGTN